MKKVLIKLSKMQATDKLKTFVDLIFVAVTVSHKDS